MERDLCPRADLDLAFLFANPRYLRIKSVYDEHFGQINYLGEFKRIKENLKRGNL